MYSTLTFRIPCLHFGAQKLQVCVCVWLGPVIWLLFYTYIDSILRPITNIYLIG